MKKNELIVLFGQFLLGFSIYRISFIIFNISQDIIDGDPILWSIIETINLVWLILLPIVVLGVGVTIRLIGKTQSSRMKKNEFIILFGLILLGFSIYQISGLIYNISRIIFNGYTIDWKIIDTLFLIWWILPPIVVLGVGGVVRFIEKERDAPQQIAQPVSKVIENMKFCTNCGKQNPKTAKFCIDCGEKWSA